MALSGILVPAVVAYLATPKADPLIRALASLGALLFAGSVAYAWKLLSIPAQMASEEADRAAAASAVAENSLSHANAGAGRREQDLQETIAGLKAEVAALKAPPPRFADPDAIFQYGKKVGTAAGARQIGGGMWSFESITIGADYSPAAPFQYRDYTLEVGQAEGQIQRGGTGQLPAVTVIRPVCRVIGRA